MHKTGFQSRPFKKYFTKNIHVVDVCVGVSIYLINPNNNQVKEPTIWIVAEQILETWVSVTHSTMEE